MGGFCFGFVDVFVYLWLLLILLVWFSMVVVIVMGVDLYWVGDYLNVLVLCLIVIFEYFGIVVKFVFKIDVNYELWMMFGNFVFGLFSCL